MSDLLSSVNRYVHRCLQVAEDSYNNSCSKLDNHETRGKMSLNGACVQKYNSYIMMSYRTGFSVLKQ